MIFKPASGNWQDFLVMEKKACPREDLDMIFRARENLDLQKPEGEMTDL
jgi:hypothetical protein